MTVTIKRFVAFDGLTHHSIRKRTDGFFQIFRDGYTLEDGSQPYGHKTSQYRACLKAPPGQRKSCSARRCNFAQ